MYKILLLLFTAISISNSSIAATIQWNGNTNNDWNIGSNWVGGTKPSSDDYALINGASYHVDLSNFQSIKGVHVINGTLNIKSSGTMVCGDGTLPGIWCQGTINIENGANIFISDIVHAGILLQSGNIINNGFIDINNTSEPGIHIYNSTSFINNKDIFIEGTPSSDALKILAGGIFSNTNNSELIIGGIYTINGRGIMNQGMLLNATGATILIDKCNMVGIENLVNSSINNSGSIKIGTIEACLSGIANFGTINNHNLILIKD